MSKSRCKEAITKSDKRYELTPPEREAIESLLARQKGFSPVPRIKAKRKAGAVVEIAPDHPDLKVAMALLMNAVGANKQSFLDGLLGQLINAGAKGDDLDERTLNFMLSVVTGIEPKDQVEAMLAAQMAAVHVATMTFTRRLAHVENIPQQDSAERAFNKLARTFTAQVEALQRYRGKGQQKMTIEHVHVHSGGQAIVGSVNQTSRGEGEPGKSEEQPDEKQISHAPLETVPSDLQTVKEALRRTSR